MKKIFIPNSVKYIIPDSVTFIGSYALKNCTNVKIRCSSASFAVQYAKANNITYELTDNLSDPDEEENIISEFRYTYYNGNDVTAITEYTGSREKVFVPSSIDGYQINGIDEGAFAGNEKIKKITINAPVSFLGEDVFKGCTSLEEVILPSTLKIIGNGCFSGCTSLKNINLPDSVYRIDGYAFDGCTNLQDIVIPKSVKVMPYNEGHGKAVFRNCYNLGTITVQGDAEIDFEALCHPSTSLSNYPYIIRCYSHTPSAIYGDMYGISYQLLDADDSVSAKDDDFTYNENDDGTLCIWGYNGNATHISVPETIQGKTVTTISRNAFWYNVSIKEVRIPDTVQKIGVSAFYGCSALEIATLSSDIDVISDNLFYGCLALKRVDMPTKATIIGDEAFRGCTSLASITLNESLQSIGYRSFFSSGLIEIQIPASVSEISYTAFDNCSHLTSIIVDNENSNFVSYDNILFDSEKYIWIFPQSHSKKITINGDTIVGGIGEDINGIQSQLGFKFCYDSKINRNDSVPIEEIVIKNGVKNIGANAFNGLDKLKTVSLPESLESIRETAFSGCRCLEKLDIPDSVDYIGTFAFSSCSSLKQVKMPNNNSCFISSGAFDGCPSLGEVVFPDFKTSNCLSQNPFHGLISDKLINNNISFCCYKCSAIDSYAQNKSIKTHYVGHTSYPTSVEKDSIIKPTCTKTGLTEGKHCSVCGEVIVKQETILATKHNYKLKLSIKLDTFFSNKF